MIEYMKIELQPDHFHGRHHILRVDARVDGTPFGALIPFHQDSFESELESMLRHAGQILKRGIEEEKKRKGPSMSRAEVEAAIEEGLRNPRTDLIRERPFPL